MENLRVKELESLLAEAKLQMELLESKSRGGELFIVDAIINDKQFDAIDHLSVQGRMNILNRYNTEQKKKVNVHSCY